MNLRLSDPLIRNQCSGWLSDQQPSKRTMLLQSFTEDFVFPSLKKPAKPQITTKQFSDPNCQSVLVTFVQPKSDSLWHGLFVTTSFQVPIVCPNPQYLPQSWFCVFWYIKTSKSFLKGEMKQEILCTVLNSESSKVSEFSNSLYPTDNIGVYFCVMYFLNRVNPCYMMLSRRDFLCIRTPLFRIHVITACKCGLSLGIVTLILHLNIKIIIPPLSIQLKNVIKTYSVIYLKIFSHRMFL